jgi:hypothetical protein
MTLALGIDDWLRMIFAARLPVTGIHGAIFATCVKRH